jgi:hypothetical protein
MKIFRPFLPAHAVVNILLFTSGFVRAWGGLIAVDYDSELPSDLGCILAFAYNQKNHERLVVLDEVKRQRYEVSLSEPGKTPFWYDGKLFVIHVSGVMQTFVLSSNQLVEVEQETFTNGVVAWTKFSRSDHRLYIIWTKWNPARKEFQHKLQAIDFPSRNILWTQEIEEFGPMMAMEDYVSVNGLKHVQVFDKETGRLLGTVNAKPPPTETSLPSKP